MYVYKHWGQNEIVYQKLGHIDVVFHNKPDGFFDIRSIRIDRPREVWKCEKLT